MTIKTAIEKEKAQKAFEYLMKPKEEREPLKQFLREAHIQKKTFYALELLSRQSVKENAQSMAVETIDIEKKKRLHRAAKHLNYDSDDFLRKQTPEADEALMKRIIDKNDHNALTIFYKRLGMLVEKQEIKHDFSAAEYDRIAIEVVARLRDRLQQYGGACPVCQRQHLLPDKIRQD